MRALFNKTAFVSTLLAFVFVSAQAAHVSTAQTPAPGRSSKKIAADQNTLTAPQVLEVGDSTLGARVNQGSTFEGASAVGVNFEHLVRPNFGLGAQFDYANYSTRYNSGGVSGDYAYTAYALALFGSFHFDLLKVKNLDTFVTGGAGRTYLTNSWKSSEFGAPGNADTGTTFFMAYINARYFVDSKLGITAQLGTGLGALGIGIDYLF